MMTPLTKVLITIALNLALLAANGAWLLSEFRMARLWCGVGTRTVSISIESDGWLLQSFSNAFT